MHLCVFFHCSKYFICSYQSNHTIHCTLLPPRSPLRAPSRPFAKAPGSTPLSQQRWGGWKPQPAHSPFPLQEKPGQDTKRGDSTHRKAAAMGRAVVLGPCHLLISKTSGFAFLCLQWHWLWGPLCPAPSYVFRSPTSHHRSPHLWSCFGLFWSLVSLYELSPHSHISFSPFHDFPPTWPISSSSNLHPEVYFHWSSYAGKNDWAHKI